MSTCPKCNEEHQKPGRFCSRTCANSRGPRSDEIKRKVSLKLAGKSTWIKGKELVERTERIYSCSGCIVQLQGRFTEASWRKRRKTCSPECEIKVASISGLKSVHSQKEMRRSKNEIYFHDLCFNQFEGVLSNEPMMDGMPM